MKNILILFTAFFFLMPAIAACEEQAPPAAEEAMLPTGQFFIESVATGKKHEFTVELALTPQQQMQGLMNRQSMPEDHGMLFIFGAERPRNFWMKDTYIPLDIVFIRADGTIANIADAKPLDETTVPSDGPVLTVLELNAGTAEKLGIRAEDKAYLAQEAKTLAQ